MKRIFWGFIFILSFFIFSTTSFAQSDFKSGDTIVLPSDQTINKDYFVSGKNVSLDGTVDGDAYIAGGDVSLNGTVNGDLLAAGGNININGLVTGNIRAAGGNIVINGKVGRNITVVGGSVVATPNAQIDGSFTSAGGNLSLLSPIGKEANLAGGQVNIGSTVGGDITAGVDQLSLSPLAKVKGNITYWSQNKANINQQASVSGNITQKIPPKRTEPKISSVGKATVAGLITVLKLISFLTALVFGLIILKLFPTFSMRVSQATTDNMLLSLGVGFLTLVISPLAVIFLLITVIGIPFAILWVFYVVFDMWLAKIFIALAIGVYISDYFKQKWGTYLAFFSGLIIYYVIGIVPIIGGLFGFLAGLVGFGSIIITKRNYYIEMQKKKLL